MSAIKTLFSGPPKPDTSALEETRKRQAEQDAKLAKEEERQAEEERSQRRATNAARAGRSGSNLFGLATGVGNEGGASTLGGG